MREAVRIARECGVLGADILGSGREFDVAVRVGAGSYVCGEETAMLDSLEGLRGTVRVKPPLPARHGLVRPADGREQRAHPRRGPGDPRARGGGPPGARARPLARHPGLPAGGQRRPRRHRGDRVRDQPGRAGLRVRRRHPLGPPGARGPGRRAARRLPARGPPRRAPRLRGDGRGGRDAGPRRGGGLRRHRRHGRAGAVRDGVLRQGVLRPLHALPDRLGPRRRGHRQDRLGRRPRPQPGRCSTTSAT